jgi:steroid delta-isomerase-like uncharacterized protein
MSETQRRLSVEDRLALVEEHVQAEVDHDLDRIMATWGESPQFHDEPWDELFVGRDEIREHYAEIIGTFPDLTIEVHDRHVTEDAVILEVTVCGTHLGQWRDLPPLGRKMESRVCVLYTFDEAGLLALERTYYDKARVLEQLGLFRDPRTTSGKIAALAMPPFTILRGFGRKLTRDRNRS